MQELELYLKPANLQKRVGKALTALDRDLERAKIAKQIIGQRGVNNHDVL